MWAFYFLAAIVIWLGLASLRGGVRFTRYVRSELAKSYQEFTPFVSVFVPGSTLANTTGSAELELYRKTCVPRPDYACVRAYRNVGWGFCE